MLDLETSRTSPLDRFSYAPQPKSKFVEFHAGAMGAKLAFRTRSEPAIDRIGAAFGVPLPRQACRLATANGRTALWLGPDEWMLLQPGAEGAALLADLEPQLADFPHALVDVSHRSVTIALRGPGAALTINAACPLDLDLAAFPPGMGTRTVLGKTEIVLVRIGKDAFDIDVWRSFAPYAWQLLDEARREFARGLG